MGKLFGILALIVGLVGLGVSALAGIIDGWDLIPFFPTILPSISLWGWILPIIAVVFGIIGIIVDHPKGVAISGLIFGILGLIVRFVVMYFFSTILPSPLS